MKRIHTRILFSTLGLATLLLSSCGRISEGSKKASERIKLSTTALYETTPMNEPVDEDAADDPAIWLNPKDSTSAYIIGTDKKGGLAVYDLKGELVNFYADGHMNNVDVRYGFVLGQDTIDLVCATNRTSGGLSIYKIAGDGSLTNLAARNIQTEMQNEVYGFGMYKSPVSGKQFAYMNSKAGEVEQWELFAADSLIDAKLVRTFNLNGQVEGVVADDENQLVYIGKEEDGIWKFEAEPDASTEGTRLDKSGEKDNENIRSDIEGLAIYYLPNGKGYLLASSQGNYSYAVFERKAPHTYIGSFKLSDGEVDGVEETDGIEIFSSYLNEDFKHGLFVAQDGYNYDNEGKAAAQNFKLVPWERIAALLDLQTN